MFHFHFMGRCGREQRTRVPRTNKRNVVEHVAGAAGVGRGERRRVKLFFYFFFL